MTLECFCITNNTLCLTFCTNFSRYPLPVDVIDLTIFIILVLSIVQALTLLNQNNQLISIHDKISLKLYTFLAIYIQSNVYLHKYLNYKSTPTCFSYLLTPLLYDHPRCTQGVLTYRIFHSIKTRRNSTLSRRLYEEFSTSNTLILQ